MLRYALPEYRLPKDVLEKELQLIRRIGVNFIFNTRAGFDIPLNEIDSMYDAVFLSIGTWKEAWVYLPGTELRGVMPALLFLEAVSKETESGLGKKVVVIGGGNAAIDSARTALRMGADVTVIYRRERKDMPAIAEETEAAEAEGAEYVFLATPHRIVGNRQGGVQAIEVVKTRLGEYDSSGRRLPIPTDEIMRFECDAVVLAVGETVDLDFARASGLTLKENGTIEVDRVLARNQPDEVFRRRRPDHRRLQRIERHGLRQESRTQHRREADGRAAVRPDLQRVRLRPDRARAAQRQPAPCMRRTGSPGTREGLRRGRPGVNGH